tara:strand:- start:4090 stop:6084 length:1995 start_codon:yes stop_codon:yes gene_type:complete
MENDTPKGGQEANDKTVVATLAMALGMPFLLALFIIISSWNHIVEPNDDSVDRPPLETASNVSEESASKAAAQAALQDAKKSSETVAAVKPETEKSETPSKSDDPPAETVAAKTEPTEKADESKPAAVVAKNDAPAEDTKPAETTEPEKPSLAQNMQSSSLELEPNLVAAQPPVEVKKDEPKATPVVAEVKKDESADLALQVKELKNQLKAAEAKLVSEQAVKASLLAKVTNLEAESEKAKEWQSLGARAQARLADAQKLANNRQEKISKLENTVKTQANQIAAIEKSAKTLAVEPFQVKLRSLEAEYQMILASLDASKADAAKAESAIAASKKQVSAANAMVAKLQSDLASSQKALAVAAKKPSSTEPMEAKLRSLASENATMASQLKDAQSQMLAAQTAAASAKKQAQSAAAKAHQMISSSNTEMMEMKQALIAAQKAPKKDANIEAYEAQLRSITAENKALRSRLTGMEAQIASHDTASNKLRHQVASLNRQLSQTAVVAKAPAAKPTPDVAALQELHAKTQERLASAQKLANTRGETIQTLQAQLKSARDKMVVVTSKPPAAADSAPLKVEVESLAAKLSTEQAVKADLMRKVSDLQTKLKTAAANSDWLNKLGKEITILKQQNAETQARLAEVQAQAQSRHEKFSQLESAVSDALKGEK